jgi:acetate kinase
MPTLIINAGSSSLRLALFDKDLEQTFEIHTDRVKNHNQAIKTALAKLPIELKEIKKVAHRVVHGGEKFTKPTLLTKSGKLNPKIIKELEALSPLAPLHNPANLEAIKASHKLLTKAKHYAIFDTAFHANMPEEAYLYGLPYQLYKKHGIRRYGFHGTSHKFVAEETCRILKKPQARIISCHIGNGVSLAAIRGKTCLDTSMGFTPLEGPMMGTRSGSIDPAIIFHLAQKSPGKPAMKLEKIQHMLQHESGFLGLSENSSDIRDLWAKPKSPGTLRTFKTFGYQMAKIITSYLPILGGHADALVFTAGIGENAWYLRKEICDHLKPLDIRICNRRNKAKIEGKKPEDPVISNQYTKTKILVLQANEELQMAREIAKF